MDLWDHVTADRIEVVEDTETVQRWVDRVALEQLFDPASWRELAVLCEVVPSGEVLPVRGRYAPGGSWQIGVNPYHASEPVWYALADVVAAALISGRAPRITRAVRLVPSGRQAGLCPVALGGELMIDPTTRDVFAAVIEERRRVKQEPTRTPVDRERLDRFLKVLANATSYGIYAEMIRSVLPADQGADVDVWGVHGRFASATRTPEDPGEYAFPPMAALITAGARLMLALLERCVTDAGGVWAMCDTDSMAIVATPPGDVVACPGGGERTPHGAPAVKALSFDEVERIRARFAALVPYDRDLVTDSILELEDENFADAARTNRRQLWCYSISAKRYALFAQDAEGRALLRAGVTGETPGERWSEHGLGYLVNPIDPDSEDRDWVRELWDYLITADGIGDLVRMPEWSAEMAVMRMNASSPAILVRRWAADRSGSTSIPPTTAPRPSIEWATSSAATSTNGSD